MNTSQLIVLDKIKQLYVEGINIIEYVNGISESLNNTEEAILISYEFQAGSYIKRYYENEAMYVEYASHIAAEISQYHAFSSDGNSIIMEAGIGEATTFKNVRAELSVSARNCYGFDLSWSRLNAASKFFIQQCIP